MVVCGGACVCVSGGGAQHGKTPLPPSPPKRVRPRVRGWLREHILGQGCHKTGIEKGGHGVENDAQGTKPFRRWHPGSW